MSTPTARRLEPRALEKIWGSTDVEPWFPADGRKIGEVWFEPETVPLLLKFIYTSDRLSVQVHPDDEQARAVGEPRGKTEMWHILRTAEGANLALGFKEEISLEYLEAAALDGSIEDLLRWIPISPGETYFIPAGTVHAIGSGVVLCEIQQKSDTTYRLYDYGRPRELHLKRALDCAVSGPWEPNIPRHNARRPWRRIVESRYFDTDLTSTTDPFDLDPGILLVLSGSGLINGSPFRTGDCWEVSGGRVRVSPDPGSNLLRTGPPAV